MDKTRNDEHARKNRKRLVSRHKVRNIVGLALLGVLVLGIAAYLIVDSRTYVATVDGNRIMAYEYKFLLRQQVSTVEKNEGLTDKTQAEKDAYWTSTENGQNPLETAKNETLNSVKQYEIQLIKASQMGLKVDANVKSYADQYLKSYQSQKNFDDKAFANYIKENTGVSLEQLRTITERLYLIDNFQTQYAKNNYKPADITDDQMKTEYDANPQNYDTVDFSYVVISKMDNSGAALSKDALDKKKTLANEALKKMQAGEDMSVIFLEYSEAAMNDLDKNGTGSATVGYSTDIWGSDVQPLIEYLFKNKAGTSSLVETDKLIYAVRIDKRNGFEADSVKNSVKTYLENKAETDWYSDQVHQWSLDPQYNIIKNDPVYDSISYK